MARNRNKVCYFCGKSATSSEHAPPKLMFRKFDCDSITVPSCDDHNSSKSGEDQAIISAFVQSLDNLFKHGTRLSSNVVKGIRVTRSSYTRTKKKVRNVPFVDSVMGMYRNLAPMAYYQGQVEIWIVHLTAALVFDGTGFYNSAIDWSTSRVWSPDWIKGNRDQLLTIDNAKMHFIKNNAFNAEFNKLTWVNGWSAEPKPYPKDIYNFKIHFANSSNIVFCHRFYNSYRWYVGLTLPSETIVALRSRLESNQSNN